VVLLRKKKSIVETRISSRRHQKQKTKKGGAVSKSTQPVDDQPLRENKEKKAMWPGVIP